MITTEQIEQKIASTFFRQFMFDYTRIRQHSSDSSPFQEVLEKNIVMRNCVKEYEALDSIIKSYIPESER